jgi:hypothetical protein
MLFLAVFGLFIIVLATIALHAPALTYNASYVALSAQTGIQTTVTPSRAHPTAMGTPLTSTIPVIGKGLNAAQNLKRVNQLDCGQYASASECTLWAYSACSTTAMTEVINAYGYHYRITDVLRQEVAVNAITPQDGLLDDQGIERTAARFGFTTTWGDNLSLDQVIALANKGTPVIVGWPPAKYDGGHLVVVIGGDSTSVKLADSSRYNREVLSRAQFLKWWAGYSAVLSPGAYSFIGKPTLTASFINQVLASYHSPAAGKGQALYDLGVKYGVDPAYALAFFLHESTFGTTGEARKTIALGNERCISDRPCVDRDWGGYAQMFSWEDGFDHFYRLIFDGYVYGQVTIPIVGYPCLTIDQTIPVFAPSSDNNDVSGYIGALKHELKTWWSGQLRP